MAETQSFDLIVIGGGPAGYVGAIRAAQLGMNVACIERGKLGGVCLNWGCIPTKALLAQAEFMHTLHDDAPTWGITAENVQVDWSRVIDRSRDVASQLNKGVHGLFKKNKITHLEGHAKITRAATDGQPCEVEIHDEPGHVAQRIEGKNIIIATGAQPRPLPDADFDGEKIISSKQAMVLSEKPQKLLIVGAGAIGMEFAYFYNAFGTEVTVVEMLDRLLPIEDDEVSKTIARSFKKQGVNCLTAHKTLNIEKTDTGIQATVAPVDDEEKTQTIEADRVLVAIGVMGRYDGLFDESLGIELFKQHIKVDKSNYATSAPGIYAVGDVIGPPWLAHVASEECIVCVELLAGEKPQPVNYDAIPGCTYCHPQVASLGKTERALADEGLKKGEDYVAAKFPFQASGKAQAAGHTEGFVKVLADKKYGEILGVHMIGENVTELIAEYGLAIANELTIDEVIHTIHAHPTLAEANHEAALGADGRMIHF